ncbi:MAG: MCE family protein, partial [Pedobacter sp.]
YLSIEEDMHKYIHKDAGASIGADGLIGNKIVVLTGGNPKFPFVEDGDVLKVNSSLSTDDIMKTLQVNNKNLVDVTGDFKVLARNLVEGKGAAGALLSDEQLAMNFKTMVSNLNRITLSTAQTAQDLNTFGKTLNSKDGLVNKMMTDTAVFAKLERSATSLQQTAKSASLMAANLEKASGKLNTSDNAAGLLLNDAKTAEQVKSIMTNLEKGSKKLDEDLEALQSNFLFRGFFKKRARDSIKNQ